MNRGIIAAESMKERSAALAGALSFAATGLGQMYNGELARGVVFLLLRVLATALVPAAALTGKLSNLMGTAAAATAFALAIALASIAEAAWCAATRRSVPLAPYHRAGWYVAYFLGSWLLLGAAFVSLVPVAGLDRVEGSRMEPSFAAGETVLLAWHRRGALVPGDAVLYRAGEETRMGRVLALPGDTVSLKDGAVWVNGAMLPAGVLSDDEAAQLAVVNEETLFYESNGGRRYAVYAKPESMSAARPPVPERELAKGRYMVACDNRLEEDCFEEIEEGEVLAKVEGIVVGKSWRRCLGSGFVR
jgi:signal peptidase I